MSTRKMIAFIVIILSVLQTMVVSAEVSITNLKFQAVIETVKNDTQGNSLIIYQDESRDFILYYTEGKVRSYQKGEVKVFESNYKGNIPAQQDAFEGIYYGTVQISPDQNLIVFYDEAAHTYIYSVSDSTLKNISFPLAKVIWNESGKDYEFVSSQTIFREGMTGVYIFPKGLYMKNSDGSLKQIVTEEKSVRLIKRKGDGVHFSMQDLKTMDENFFNSQYGLKEEIVYNVKTGSLQYIPYLPDSTKIIVHKNLNEYTGLSENNTILPGVKIHLSGKYVLAPIRDKYIRYDKLTKEIKPIPAPIGLYKRNIYYLQKPHITGSVYKMNINTLKASKNPIGYAVSNGFVFQKNIFYYLNPQKDANGNIKDVPYSYNLDNGRLTKNSKAPVLNEYHIFVLKNKYRLCVYFNRSADPLIHLEDANGRIILSRVLEFSDGYFYQTGLSEDNFPVINKVDINGKTIKTIFKAPSKGFQITSMRVVGINLFLTSGYNFYSCDITNGKYNKY
jgi:hypothetical protein